MLTREYVAYYKLIKSIATFLKHFIRHLQVNLLLDIWRDYREETLQQVHKRPQSLPEPPAARERLKQEICFFVENLRERAQREGRYVIDHGRACVTEDLNRKGQTKSSPFYCEKDFFYWFYSFVNVTKERYADLHIAL